MLKLLYIAKYFPPLGGAGTQRSLKFVKYLPDFGVAPVVLTGKGKSADRWSPEDSTMLDEIPPEVAVVRVAWRDEPGGDRQAAFEAGLQAARNHKVRLIFVSMSPFEDAELAGELARHLQIPWVADLRDPWALDEFQIHRTFWHRRREQRRMGEALKSASLVVMNTPEAAARLLRTFPSLDPSTVVSVTNGFDAEDFQGEAPERSQTTFTIVHSGYLHTDSGLRHRRRGWIHGLLGGALRGMEPLSRSHYYLLRALERWFREDPKVVDSVKLALIGLLSPVDERLVKHSPVEANIEMCGYLDHQETIRRVRSASLLFLPMHSLPEGMRAGIVPGKTYEYMASGRPILAAVPPGDAKDFLQAAGTASFCHPADVDAMVRILKTRFAAWQTGGGKPGWNREWVERFERRRLTGELAGHLHDCLNRCSQ